MKIMMSSLCGRILFNEPFLEVMEWSLVSIATQSTNNQDGLLLCREAPLIVRVNMILILLELTEDIPNYFDFKCGDMCVHGRISDH